MPRPRSKYEKQRVEAAYGQSQLGHDALDAIYNAIVRYGCRNDESAVNEHMTKSEGLSKLPIADTREIGEYARERRKDA